MAGSGPAHLGDLAEAGEHEPGVAHVAAAEGEAADHAVREAQELDAALAVDDADAAGTEERADTDLAVGLQSQAVGVAALVEARLQAVFSGGVCDYGKKGVGQVRPDGVWQSF